MTAFYFTASRNDGTTLCLAPLTDKQIEASGCELTDTSGHFLFERGPEELDQVRILAQVVGLEAVESMRTMLGLT